MEGRIEGKRGRGKPRQKLMDWMMEDGYRKLKERAHLREECTEEDDLKKKEPNLEPTYSQCSQL